ncbi:MAG: hypothetical protein ACRD0A_07845 [Acidimicrobiales bacterium]
MTKLRGLLATLLVFLLPVAACDVTTEVLVDVEESGAGTVTVSVGLDADAVARVPDLDDLVLVDDLAAAGWTVAGPARDAGGTTWIRAEKSFATPEQANAILSEISGPNGPFRGFALTRERALARTRIGIDGTIDLTGGLSVFSDAALAQSLEGQPLGEPIEQIEARLGEGVADVFSFELAVRLPGEVESNAAVSGDAGGAVWAPSLADTAPTEVEASSEVVRRTTVLAIVAGGTALVLLLAWLVIRLAGPDPNVGWLSRL